MHSPTATVARRPKEEDQSDQQVVLDAASFLTAMRNTDNSDLSNSTTANQPNPETTSATRTTSSNPHHFSTNEDAAGHPFKKNTADKAKITHQNNSTSAPQTLYDLVPTNTKPKSLMIRKVGPHHLHREEQVLYYSSSSAERRGHPKSKSTFSLRMRTARNWEQQVAPMPVPRQSSLLQDSDAAMKAAQSLYYQHMIDAHARHQYGHFAMMSMQHQAPTVSMNTQALPPPPHRLQPQQARPPPHRLQQQQEQQQHSGLVGNTRKRHLPSIPINPAASSNDTPRVGSNFYHAQEMQGSGGMANNNFTSKHTKVQHTRHYPRPKSNATTATNSATCTSPSANSSTTGVDSAFVHARSSHPKSHKKRTAVPNSTRGSAESNVPATRFVDGSNVQELRHLLTPQDRHLTTQFSVSIIDQLDFVYFEEGDRRSHRTHLPIGFRGICCRFCKAAPGKSGRFFPSSLKTLSDTQKTLYTLHRHFIKCKQTPVNVQEMLHKQRENHLEERKTRKCHGSQRAFFRRIWGFLCPEAEGDSIASCTIDKTKEDKEAKAL
jgi:hypothetical protein